MKGSFFSMIVNRKSAGWIGENIVVFGTDSDILQVADRLADAVDVVQSRLLYAHFLIEVSDADVLEPLMELDDAFEFDAAARLWCISVEERSQLPEPIGYVSDFDTYCRMFRVMSHVPEHPDLTPIDIAGSIQEADHQSDRFVDGDDEVDIDSFWSQLYAEEGLICFRLILSN